MNRIRVLVVEDSLTVRKFLVNVLQSSPEFDVVGEAADGKRAIELCCSLKPDVVTMDMMMPLLTGVAATEYIMAYCPTPILIVSASTNRGEVFKTYEALSAGALDVLEKPKLGSDPQWATTFLATLRMISRIKVITHPRGRIRSSNAPQSTELPNGISPNTVAPPAVVNRGSLERNISLVAIGASTGGPAALAEILAALPQDFSIPILVVIHITEAFSFAMAEWLNTQSRIPVRHARNGERIPFGSPSVLLAPATHHLLVDGDYLRYDDSHPRHSCRPSVDVLFDSVADSCGSSAILCLLTGMGKDGAAGLLRARAAGALTIAQDEATSVIFGMPGEAVRLGAAERVLPLDQISRTIVTAVALARRSE